MNITATPDNEPVSAHYVASIAKSIIDEIGARHHVNAMATVATIV